MFELGLRRPSSFRCPKLLDRRVKTGSGCHMVGQKVEGADNEMLHVKDDRYTVL